MSHPKTRQTCQAPLLKMTRVISGVVKPKDKTKAKPSPFAKRLRQVTGVISGDITPKTRQTCQAPVLKITVIRGAVKKKVTRIINKLIELEL